MTALLSLPFTKFSSFEIIVSRIYAGWMDIDILNEGNTPVSYSASYLTDPLNDLLSAAVLFVKYKKQTAQYKYVPPPRMCFYTVHELEPSEITWLFTWHEGEMILVIWEDVSAGLQDLIDRDFDEESYTNNMIKNYPDLEQGLLLAVKDSPVPFLKALTRIFPALKNIERLGDGQDWGFNYSKDKLAILEDWLAIQKGLK